MEADIQTGQKMVRKLVFGNINERQIMVKLDGIKKHGFRLRTLG